MAPAGPTWCSGGFRVGLRNVSQVSLPRQPFVGTREWGFLCSCLAQALEGRGCGNQRSVRTTAFRQVALSLYFASLFVARPCDGSQGIFLINKLWVCPCGGDDCGAATLVRRDVSGAMCLCRRLRGEDIALLLSQNRRRPFQYSGFGPKALARLLDAGVGPHRSPLLASILGFPPPPPRDVAHRYGESHPAACHGLGFRADGSATE